LGGGGFASGEFGQDVGGSSSSGPERRYLAGEFLWGIAGKIEDGAKKSRPAACYLQLWQQLENSSEQ
jgi:hypothetical protein